jgi:hypothetical protein
MMLMSGVMRVRIVMCFNRGRSIHFRKKLRFNI